MSEPRRLKDDDGFAAALLRSATDDAPGPNARRAIAAAIGIGTIAPAAIGHGTAAAATTATAPTGAATVLAGAAPAGIAVKASASIAAKLLVGLALTTGISIGVGVVVTSSTTPRAPIAHGSNAPATPSVMANPAQESPSTVAAPTVTPPATPTVATSATPSVTTTATPSVTTTATPSVTTSATPSVTTSATPSVTTSATPSAATHVTPSRGVHVATPIRPPTVRTPRPLAATRTETRTETAPSAIAANPPTTTESPAATEPVAAEPVAAEPVAVAPAVTGPTPPPRAASPSLTDEVALLDHALAALHRGEGAAALLVLDRYDRAFPRGVLAPEATVARIEALVATGELDRARKLAATFLAANGHSPLAHRVRQSIRAK